VSGPEVQDRIFHLFYCDWCGKTTDDADYKESKAKIHVAEEVNKLPLNKYLKKEKEQSEFLDDLVYSTKIQVRTLDVLCQLFKKRKVYLDGQLWYDMDYAHGPIHVLSLKDNERWVETKQEFEETRYKVESWTKPIKSISVYTVPVLEQFCRQLKLPYDPSKKKKEVYDMITNHLKELLSS
jgi:hypothetical protein